MKKRCPFNKRCKKCTLYLQLTVKEKDKQDIVYKRCAFIESTINQIKIREGIDTLNRIFLSASRKQK